MPLPAAASWLDSDFYCRVYGCVVVHDGFTFDVYDNYIFAGGGSVPPGGRMIPWTGNPFQGAGGVNPVITGTRTEGFHSVPLEDQSFQLGIDQTGNGEIDMLATGTQDGFLDAGSQFQAFEVTDMTGLRAVESSSTRSFYVSSRTDFTLSAQAYTYGNSGELSASSYLSRVKFNYGVTRSGRDDGMQFGANTRNGNYIRDIGGIDNVGEFFGVRRDLLEFRNDIRFRESDDLPSQSVRFDYTYGFEGYDLSMGAGHLRYRIEFDFYNR